MWHTTVRLMVLLTLGVLAVPLAATAQPRASVPRIGILNTGTPALNPYLHEAFRQGLRELGWVENQNILLEHRWAEGKLERLADFAAELVHLKVDVLFTPSTLATRAAQDATRTIPIVALTGDPVGAGFVASLARPGGNITGLTPRAEITTKGLELLKELVPTAARVAVLWNPADQSNVAQWSEVQVAATALGVTLHSLAASSPAELEQVRAGMRRESADALIVCGGSLTTLHRPQILAMAAQHHLPATYPFREFVEAGGLMGYVPNRVEIWRRAAAYVDKILQGAKPADLPVERADKYELILNFKTAATLGITFPPTLLLLADEVIK